MLLISLEFSYNILPAWQIWSQSMSCLISLWRLKPLLLLAFLNFFRDLGCYLLLLPVFISLHPPSTPFLKCRGLLHESAIVLVSLHPWEMSAGLTERDDTQTLGLSHLVYTEDSLLNVHLQQDLTSLPCSCYTLNTSVTDYFPSKKIYILFQWYQYLFNLPHIRPLITFIHYLKLRFFIPQSRFYHFSPRYLTF